MGNTLLTKEQYQEDMELLMRSIDCIIHNQKQIIQGIIALARKEGMLIKFEEGNKSITFDDFLKNSKKK